MTDRADVDAFYTEVGRRVRSARSSYPGEPWTQAQLAHRCGLTRASVANLEAGKQRVPIHTIVQIAWILDIPVSELVPALSTRSPISVDLPDDLPASSREFILRCLEGL